MAVASPSWIKNNDPIDSIEALKSAQLINLEEPYRNRPTWQDFFRNFDTKYQDTGKGLRLNDYAFVLHAVVVGEGLSLGWEHVNGA